MNTKEQVLQKLQQNKNALLPEELAQLLGIEQSEWGLLEQTLATLEKEGVVSRSKKGRYTLAERAGYLTGKIQSTKGGSDFFLPENGTEDLYIFAGNNRGAMHGDRVLVRPLEPGRARREREGEVVRILERGQTRLVGTVMRKGGGWVVLPDDKRLHYALYLKKGDKKHCQDGLKVVARIDTYPTEKADMTGSITEVLGHADDVGTDILSIIKSYDLPESFPEKVLEAARAVPAVIPAEELAKREDLREKTIITIDGADSKDLDDAVSVERLPGGDFLLGVHIADVAYYVQPDGILDQEAQKRGTSVYLIDRVLPMLPPELSNGICSLNPRQDRLTLSAFMTIGRDGQQKSYRIAQSVIRTTERMTYRDVSRILCHNDVHLSSRYSAILEDLQTMEELMHILRKNREARGSIDFDLDEAKIKLDEMGKPISVTLAQRDISNQIIEEFMLAANETVAAHMQAHNLPALYRIHELPDEDKVEQFNEFIHNFGYHLRFEGRMRPKVFQELLQKLQGKPEELLISRLMLRSMRKAVYSPQNLGHFGLAAENYLHFTSPIRRYPDLVVHRAIHWSLEGETGKKKLAAYASRLEELAQHSSATERTADDAERDVEDLKKAEYMQGHIGEEYEGIISGVTAFGLFTELPDTIEGFTHISQLEDDYYDFNEKLYALVGQRKRRVFRLGDKVRIRVANIKLADRRIEFAILENLT